MRGSISPLVKDRDGDVVSSANYRAITLSSIFMQMYEILLKGKFGYFLATSDLQFGFKPGVSTSHAIFGLKKTADFFTSTVDSRFSRLQGTRVICLLLQMSLIDDRILKEN